MKTHRPILAVLLLGALQAGSVAPLAAEAPAVVGKPLPAWRDGELDIHHINTGRGDAAILVMPDGTSLLIDASGATVEKPPFTFATRPDASRPPGEWVARYVRRVLPESSRQIDYVLISHFHGDHMGAIKPGSPWARNGVYQLSGITEVAEHIRIGTMLDRGWPDYDDPAPIDNPTVSNYRKFLDWQIAHRGLKVERLQPGRNDQIRLLHAAEKYPGFEVRNLYSGGVVWSGEGMATRNLVPALDTLDPSDHPTENKLSNAVRVSYGKFDYFNGGDLSSIDEETTADPAPWKNLEPAVAQAAGAVDAMKANHHGSWDANGIPFLAILQPRVIVVTSRADGHPAVNTWKRMTSRAVWKGERDIFVTSVSPATAATTYDIGKIAKSMQGHVVIRVQPGGASYRVFVLDDGSEDMTVKAIFGPYASN